MYKLINEYLDRDKVGRQDFFRQLIYITFAPLSIILFSLHFFGSYGLYAKPALACSACFIVVTVVASSLHLWKGPKMLNRLLPPNLRF